MIESMNTNELMGQYELDDLLPADDAGTVAASRARHGDPEDGYDADGNLLNVDYPPVADTAATEGTVLAVPRDGTDSFTAAEGAADNRPITTHGTEEPSPCRPDADRLSVLATEINAITEQTRGVVISAALAVGKRLIEAKSLCPAGRFGEWLEKSVSYSERKAQDMMRLYVEYGRDGAIPESIAALDYSKAVALLAAPAEARETLAEKAAEEDLSVRQLNAEIAKLKAEVDRAQLRFDIADKENEEKDNLIRDYDRGIEKMHDELNAANVAIEKEREAAQLANAKAAAAEAAAEELRKLRSAAEERADKNDQRARDAVNRANRTAVDLSEARARIAALEAQAAEAPEPEVRTVELVPEAVQQELADLRARLAEAQANRATDVAASRARHSEEQTTGASAAEKFKWFYANQMKPAFTTALSLLKEVAQEDGHAASLFATALTRGCQQLMDQLGASEE